ncbi:unnamed protein product [Didymodactylos carnosus]|uniref:CCHC-type domain-containing protein n=1 Tax=Didymodactylos carnosus TaxID=1234261 RepID=A0A8S2ET63_9BILA|nr:unnamed protein product [Didymodactylos carnosus]CAF4109122.1 unnamed protein product [Didymodactylos carnosus]
MLLRRYAKIFDTTKPSVIDTTIQHAIDLEDGSRPTTAAYYRQNPHYTGRPQSQICYRCGQHGHFRRECPTQPRLKGRGGQW